MANLLASSIGAMALQKAVAEDTLAAARAETAALQARLEASDVAELETALCKAEAEVQEAQRGWQTARNALGQSEYVRARLTERLKRCKQTIVTLNDRLFEGGRERRAARLRVDMAEGKLEVALSDATHARDVAASHRAQRSQAQMETRWALEEAGEARLQAEEARKAAAAATADAAQARAQAAQAERVASEATAKADGLAKDLDRTETEVAAARRELDRRIQSSFSIPAKKAISLAVKVGGATAIGACCSQGPAAGPAGPVWCSLRHLAILSQGGMPHFTPSIGAILPVCRLSRLPRPPKPPLPQPTSRWLGGLGVARGAASSVRACPPHLPDQVLPLYHPTGPTLGCHLPLLTAPGQDPEVLCLYMRHVTRTMRSIWVHMTGTCIPDDKTHFPHCSCALKVA